MEKHLNDEIGNHLAIVYFDQDKKVKQLTQEQGEHIKLLTNKLNQSNQEIENLRKDNKQLRVAKEKQDRYMEQQDKRIEHLEEQLKLLAYAPFAFRYPKKLAVLPNLLSFVSNNENQEVFNNLVDLLREESVLDCQVVKNAWSYKKNDDIIFIWVADNFKLNPEIFTKSPIFDTGENGYPLAVVVYWLNNAELHFFLLRHREEAMTKIKSPHQQHFRVAIINFKDRQNDVSAEKTFKMTKDTDVWRESDICIATSSEEINESLLNDKLFMKISIKQYSA